MLDVYVGCNLNDSCAAVMPFKYNSGRRHRIGKTKFKVRNWPEYEAGLRRRGSLTLWVTSEALSKRQAPRRKTLAASIAIPIWRSRPDAGASVWSATAPGRKPIGMVSAVDEPGLCCSRSRDAEPAGTDMAILHQTPAHKPSPDGPLHVLIDSTGLLARIMQRW